MRDKDIGSPTSGHEHWALGTQIRVGVLFALAVTAIANAAFAGINLGWGDCGDADTADRTFGCTTDTTGSSSFVVSFNSDHPINGWEAVILLESGGDALLPDWWALQPGGCREGAITLSCTRGPSDLACAEVMPGCLTALFGYSRPGTTRQATLGVLVLYGGDDVAVDPTLEYFGGRFTINHTLSSGAGSCAGCSQGIEINLDSIALRQTTGGTNVESPIRQTRITWQGGPVAVARKSWGAIKGMYRY